MNGTGKTPLEILEMKAILGGFELVFTEPVDLESAGKPRFPDRNRAYQFANSASPELLNELHWSHFLSNTEEDRAAWSMSAGSVE
jgi:hypothetical protein